MGKQPITGPPHYPNCRTYGKSNPGRCFYENLHCYECGQRGHKRSECPKLIGSQHRAIPSTEPPRPPLAPPKPSFAAPWSRLLVFGTQQQARNSRKPQAGGQIYCLEAEEGGYEDPHVVVSGTFIVNFVPAKVLFDAGATHSFINLATVARMTYVFEELDVHLCVTTPIGSVYQSELIARYCAIIIQGRLFFGDLILLGIRG